jgi:SAM-dependent methyltransferase
VGDVVERLRASITGEIIVVFPEEDFIRAIQAGFDVVVCIQNDIAIFNVDQRKLIKEALHVTRSGGRVLFSSYSERFWKDRLEWFRIQSQHGLIGEIDDDATGDGVIVCKDGFKASTFSPDDFISLTSNFEIEPIITEVDGSSLVCEIWVKLKDT